MKREILNQFLGNNVTITLFDGDVVSGKLEFIAEFCQEQGWRKPGYYAIGNLDFRASHVKKLRQLLYKEDAK